MKKSIWNKLHTEKGKAIQASCSTFRELKNLTQQICTYYSYFSNEFSEREINTQYFSLNCLLSDIMDGLKNNHIVCINDGRVTADYDKYMAALLKYFETTYPEKSEKYER